MTFELVRRVREKEVEGVIKKYNNFYLVSLDTGIEIPVEIKKFYNKDKKITNIADYQLAVKFSVEQKYVESTKQN